MSEISERDLRNYRDEAEATTDRPLSASATRPGRQRTRVLSVRLNSSEFEELAVYAAKLDIPASTLVRGWVLDQVRSGSQSASETVDRIARDLQHLRQQIVA